MLSALDIPTTPTELPGVYDGEWKGSGEVFQSLCPATGEVLAHVKSVSYNICSAFQVEVERGRVRVLLLLLRIPYKASPAEFHGALERTREAYVYFRSIPAPKRGEIIRQIRVALGAKVRCSIPCVITYRLLTPPSPRFVFVFVFAA